MFDLSGRRRWTCARMPAGETDVPATAPSLIRFAFRKNGRTHAGGVRAAVQTALEKKQRRSRERYIELNRVVNHRVLEKSFYCTPQQYSN